jgi:hypothetical protein
MEEILFRLKQLTHNAQARLEEENRQQMLKKRQQQVGSPQTGHHTFVHGCANQRTRGRPQKGCLSNVSARVTRQSLTPVLARQELDELCNLFSVIERSVIETVYDSCDYNRTQTLTTLIDMMGDGASDMVRFPHVYRYTSERERERERERELFSYVHASAHVFHVSPSFSNALALPDMIRTLCLTSGE